MSLMQELGQRALDRGVPLSVQLDVTYRCNERCIHCYLDHDDHGEMTTAEICSLLDQLAEAGVFFLTLSGGEVFMRQDFFDIVEYARSLMFCVKIKTNAFMIREKEARGLRNLMVQDVQVSIYSHRPEVHDAITLLPGSLKRSVTGIRLLRTHGVKVVVANVLMMRNLRDHAGVKELAKDLGAEYTIDPTITPMMDGDRSVLRLGLGVPQLQDVFRNSDLVGDVDEFCAPPPAVNDDVLQEFPCSAGHTACYISPYGDLFPCVQFPLPSGNVRRQKFMDIWRHSNQLNEVRSITAHDLPVCSGCSHVGTCTRCPGLAYLEGNMRGPSTQDCEKSFARTGIRSANMHLKKTYPTLSGLVQIT
jgi:AdoMet-dependent heme synthase